MEKNRGVKIVAITGLIIAVGALSLGFAAFTQSLSISTNALVNPSNTTLDIEFTSTNPVEEPAVLNVSGTASTGATAQSAIINNGGDHPSISNLGATFTDKGQSVTYSFFVHNASSYVAYLRSVIFNNASGASSNKLCVAGTDTTENTVNNSNGGAACDDISISVSVQGDEYTSSNSTLSGKNLAVDEYKPVIVVITYNGTHNLPDGDFSVVFGDITLGYSSIDQK